MNIQLVLGSGGIRCFAYVGAIQELEERGYKFSSVSGVSAGALVGLLVAFGLTGKEMRDRLLAFDMATLPRRKRFLMGAWRFIPPNYSIYSQSVSKELLLSLLAGFDPQLSKLSIPFASVGLDLRTGRMFVYSSKSEPEMKASEVIAIATAVPGLFPACESGGRLLIDGVLASECPVWLAGSHNKPDPVVALRTASCTTWSRPKHVGDFFTRVVKSGIRGGDAALAHAFGNSAELTISVDEGESNFAISRQRRQLLIDEGRRQVRDYLEQGRLDFSAAEPGNEMSKDSTDAARRFMVLSAPKDTVFISYSRVDAAICNELIRALEQKFKDLPALRLWTDAQIQAGADWQREIVRAMHRTRVAVLLVSKAFLGSRFIESEEEPFFVKAAKANVLTVLWVNLDLDLRKNEENDRIRDLISFQAVNKEPLSASKDPQTIWHEVASHIERAFLHY